MHNWYQSIIARIPIYTRDEICYVHGWFFAPLLPVFPLFPLIYLLGTLLAVIGSVHLVSRLLVN